MKMFVIVLNVMFASQLFAQGAKTVFYRVVHCQSADERIQIKAQLTEENLKKLTFTNSGPLEGAEHKAETPSITLEDSVFGKLVSIVETATTNTEVVKKSFGLIAPSVRDLKGRMPLFPHENFETFGYTTVLTRSRGYFAEQTRKTYFVPVTCTSIQMIE